MTPEPTAGASYRASARAGPDPVTEADAIAELIRWTTAFRRRLLLLTLAVSLGGGAAGTALYLGTATEIYGRVAGAFFAVGGIVTFAIVHRICGAIARVRESRWIAELSGRHRLEPGALAEAMAMFGGGPAPSVDADAAMAMFGRGAAPSVDADAGEGEGRPVTRSRGRRRRSRSSDR
jgi:hypothetical protein